ncbi:MAG: hypothetical protein ACLQIB_38415 [Isosphaeraceae bacterium]
MNPMFLIRLLGCLAVAWTITAIGYNSFKGTSVADPAPIFFVPRPSLLDTMALGKANRAEIGKTSLIDRRTGIPQPVELPREQNWDLVSVSPWCGQDGKPEAVARWASRATDAGDQPFCGLGLLKLPEATVTARIATDVLPTGRACFVPGRSGEILFPAGDGQLYRCTIGGRDPGEEGADEARAIAGDSHGSAALRPLAWDCPVPASGNVLLADPAWSAEPRLRHLVLVGLSAQKTRGRKHCFEPPKLWWLELDEPGETILRAGPLVPAPRAESEIDMKIERFPTVVVGRDGKLGLVYLMQRDRTSRVELRWARLEVDAGTGVPSLSPSEKLDDPVGQDVHIAPPIVSADGRSAFAVDGSGKLVRFPIPGDG